MMHQWMRCNTGQEYVKIIENNNTEAEITNDGNLLLNSQLVFH
jgi:hypothetical protein